MTRAAGTAAQEDRLLRRAAPGSFDPAELAGLPGPVRRHLSSAVEPGTTLARAARIRMRGQIKVGRWLPFRAREVLDPHAGFRWTARVGGIITGADSYLDGGGGMRWRLAGLVPVAAASGPDVGRSAAGRAGAEGMWLPTALLPRFAVRWAAVDEDHVVSSHTVDDVPVETHYRLDAQGRIVSFSVSRWGDPDATGTWGWHPFGGHVTGWRRFGLDTGGITVPSAGRIGWYVGTDREAEGEFFRFRLTAVTARGANG